jgi:hypothetical protein
MEITEKLNYFVWKLSSGNSMHSKKLIFILLFLAAIVYLSGCDEEKPISDGTLFGEINAYRVENGLPKIPMSKSLTKVAETHVKDLVENQPVKGNCNLHSWSDKGSWTACCYTDDHAKAQCMWNKPRELTSYKGDGFEIAAWSSIDISVEQALSLWKGSAGHNNVILNKDIWKDLEWKAMGAAIYQGYAVVWFGKETDPEK